MDTLKALQGLQSNDSKREIRGILSYDIVPMMRDILNGDVLVACTLPGTSGDLEKFIHTDTSERSTVYCFENQIKIFKYNVEHGCEQGEYNGSPVLPFLFPG